MARLATLRTTAGFIATGFLLVSGCALRSSKVPKDVHWGAPMTQMGQPGQQSSPQAPVTANGPAQSPTAPVAAPPKQEAAASALSKEVVQASAALAKAIRGETKAWDRMAFMCDSFGPRPLGSKGLKDASAWATKTLSLDGLSSARQEIVELVPWERGAESARVLAPVQRDLHIIGLGLSEPTPRRGIKAELAVVHNFEELKARGEKGELKDKIVLVNGVMPPFDSANNEPYYGQTVPYRTQSASRAAKHGAKAVLVRSITAKSLQTPHTGVLWYEGDGPKIPAAAVSIEDAELLLRLAKRSAVEVELKLASKRARKPVKSANVVAELVGREKPEEIVLIGAHIDSWDKGPGAQDDATGVAMVLEAMRMLKSLNLVPKRTIRAVLFTDEESGLRGAHAYMKAHAQDRHIAAIEADMGAGAPRGLGLGGSKEVRERIGPYLSLFAPFGVTRFGDSGGGADISLLMKKGVLGISIEPEMGDYFEIHHTEADTPEKVDPAHLQAHAASMAMMAYLLAQEELNLTASVPPPSAAPVASPAKQEASGKAKTPAAPTKPKASAN